MASWRPPGSILEVPGINFAGFGDDFYKIFCIFGIALWIDPSKNPSNKQECAKLQKMTENAKNAKMPTMPQRQTNEFNHARLILSQWSGHKKGGRRCSPREVTIRDKKPLLKPCILRSWPINLSIMRSTNLTMGVLAV